MEVKLFLVVILFIFAMLRGLFVRIPKPAGVSVKRKQAPKLWLEVERLADQAGADRPAEIILDFDTNAAAVTRPRFGLLGGSQSILLLGVPLLGGLSRDQALSVIAHEFGHFAGEHGKFSGRMYRLHEMLGVIEQSLGDSAGFAFRPFFRWFNGRFSALSFVLRRVQEYEADRMAAKLTSPDIAIGALARIHPVAIATDEHVWTRLAEEAKKQPLPPPSFMGDIPQRLRMPVKDDELRGIEKHLLESEANFDDSHPSFRERARALGFDPVDPALVEDWMRKAPDVSALEDLLPDYQAVLAPMISSVFVPAWQAMNKEYAESQARKSQLESIKQSRALTWEERIDYSDLVGEDDEPAQLAMLEELHSERPAAPEVQIRLGAAYLRAGDLDGGEKLIRQAIMANAAYGPAGLQLIAQYRSKAGVTEVEDLEEAFIVSQLRLQRGQTFLGNLTPNRLYEEAEISDEVRQRLIRVLRDDKNVGEAYLAFMRHDESGIEAFVLVLGTKGFVMDRDTLVERIKAVIELPGFFTILAPEKMKPWEKAFASIPSAKLI